MPTLLSVNNYFYRRGGAEVVFLEHNRLFTEAGWSVVPFSMRHPENLPSDWFDYFPIEIEFGSRYSLPEKVSRVPKVVYSLEARRNIQRLIERVKPAVCHTHSVSHHLSPSIFASLRLAGVPTVMTLHDLKVACPAGTMFNWKGVCEECLGGRLFNVVKNRCIKGSRSLSTVVFAESLLHTKLGSYSSRIDRLIAPSHFYIEKLVEWGWPREKFVCIPNPVDVGIYEPKYESGRSILYFGRLSPEKGLKTLIRAAAKANVQLRLAGQGPELEILRREASFAGGDIVFLGHLTGPTLTAAVGRSRATVLASEWYENAPMSILESYALGKPVIGARIGGIPELISDGFTGWLFESGSVEALTSTLRVVAELCDARVEEMGRACRRLAERDYSSSLYRDRMCHLYSELGVAA